MRKRTKFFGTTVGGLSLLHTDWINQDFPPAWAIPADIGKGPARVGAFALSEALIENASPLEYEQHGLGIQVSQIDSRQVRSIDFIDLLNARRM